LSHEDPFAALPEPDAEAGSGGLAGNDTVSIQQLRHPLSHRWRIELAQLQTALNKGHVKRANKLMSKALKEPAAAPYAHGILGTHYLKEGWPAAAVPELEKAARVLPMAALHSNLGYALCLTGQTQRGEEEFQEALSLDGASPQARFLMGVVLLNQRSREREARYDLGMAAASLPTARLALAVCDLRRGEEQAAENEISQFLGPNRKSDLLRVWSWASDVASKPQPATAFGFPYQIAGSPQKPPAAPRD
jgi:Flp pilus assembly protein TadD